MTDRTPLAPAGIASEDFGGSIRGAQMSDFSGTRYVTARRFALECSPSAPPGDARTALPMAVVLLVCTALESFVNEQVEFEATSGVYSVQAQLLRAKVHQGKGAPSSRAVWKCYLALRDKEFNETQEPGAGFNDLVELRNLLVHRAAKFYGPHELPDKVASLEKRFDFTSPGDAGFIAWDQRVLNAPCARWACHTAVAIRAEHWRLVGGRAERWPTWETVPEPEAR
jgi:hypothetical protein